VTSLWLSDRPARPDRYGGADCTTEVVVVGAGLAGLVSAVLLARAGRKVLVLEARYVGAGTTGNTTGKVSVLQGTTLSRIAKRHSSEVLRAYVAGNEEGREWLLRHCEMHGLDAQREDAYTYAQSEQGVSKVRAEYDACREAGLDAHWDATADVPFPYRGGVRLPNQAQIDPMPVLQSLVVELEQHGGQLIEGVRVRSVRGADPLRLQAQVLPSDDGPEFTVTASDCILATGIPILDRGAFFARLHPQRSYCMSFEVPGPLTRPMFLSADSPTRSVRYATSGTGEQLVVGGAGHTVGRRSGVRRDLEELTAWTERHYPGAVRTHVWSAQDYTPAAGLPYAGPLLPGSENIFVATGFAKWGMTNAVAAALALSSRILGGHTEWAKAFGSWDLHDVSGLQRRGRPQPGARVGVDAGAASRPQRGRGRRRGPAVESPRREPDRRCAVLGLGGVSAPGRHRVVERRRPILGLPAARVAVRPRRHPDRGTRDQRSGALIPIRNQSLPGSVTMGR
jgi:glycine/D-amino acid oxidase-like deaminating enzyme